MGNLQSLHKAPKNSVCPSYIHSLVDLDPFITFIFSVIENKSAVFSRAPMGVLSLNDSFCNFLLISEAG